MLKTMKKSGKAAAVVALFVVEVVASVPCLLFNLIAAAARFASVPFCFATIALSGIINKLIEGGNHEND